MSVSESEWAGECENEKTSEQIKARVSEWSEGVKKKVILLRVSER